MNDASLFAIVLAAIALAMAFPAFVLDLTDDLEPRVAYIECIHRIYEDGSAVHEDAEVVQRFCGEAPEEVKP